MSIAPIRLEVSDDDLEVAYLKLPAYPQAGIPDVARTVRLRDLIGHYNGPDVHLDFDQDNTLLGIEILA